MHDLVSYRSQFNSIRDCHYLISNSLGAMPNAATEMAAQFCQLWAERGVRSWEEEWWALAREVGDKIGALIHAEKDTVTMQPNVTSAQAVILSCFDFNGPRNKVVMVDVEFPSMLYLYRSWLRDKASLQVIKSSDGISAPMAEILAAIDETTMLVPISHVLFRSSYIVDAQAIIRRAHEVGALVILDIFQSLGTLPVDVRQLDVDFAVGGCLKWLCGGPGACFMYTRPDLLSHLAPRYTGWLAHAEPFTFDRESMCLTKGSYRFLNGTPVIPAFYTCQPGLDIIAEIGVERIRTRSVEMTSRLIDKATEYGWSVFTPLNADRRGGTVSLNLPDSQEIAERLLAKDFLIDYRPGAGVRVSPHFYNTDQEIDDLIEEIAGLLGNSR